MSNGILFWAALGLIAYAYAGFPIVLLVRGALRRRPVRGAPITPRTTLVVVAHNEAATIRQKIENVYALDYPPDRLELIVASDGSTDGTNELVAGFTERGLRLLECPRGGKIPALNAAAALATGEILVFSDANSMFAPDALRALVAPFADPSVGAVGGNQLYLAVPGGHLASLGERLYWRYDRMLKRLQSRAGHMTAATGAIHAVRRDLFQPVPPGTSDDFMTSVRVITRGFRLVFEPRAVAYETVAPSEGAEFDRKLRIVVRGLRGLGAVRELFNPLRYGFYSVQLLSHKLLRWSVCWLLAVVLLSSLTLYAEGPVYRAAVHAQVAFYACAACALPLLRTRLSKHPAFRLVGIPFYFCMANYAALRAWIQVAGGRRVDTWSSTRAGDALPQPSIGSGR